MTLPLLPKATAVWLVDNTAISFGQIAEFCGMHPLEVQGIADGEVAAGIMGKDPVVSHQLTRKEIERCEQNPKAKVQLQAETEKYINTEKNKKKKSRYTPVARRQDKPDAIAWIIKHCPEAKDTQITKLIGTTKKTIEAIRDKTHWNYANLTPRDPVLLGLCSQRDLDFLLRVVNEAKEKKNSA